MLWLQADVMPFPLFHSILTTSLKQAREPHFIDEKIEH